MPFMRAHVHVRVQAQISETASTTIFIFDMMVRYILELIHIISESWKRIKDGQLVAIFVKLDFLDLEHVRT